jgi:hypothetical protein
LEKLERPRGIARSAGPRYQHVGCKEHGERVTELGRAAVCGTNGGKVARLTHQEKAAQESDIGVVRIEVVQPALRLDELSLVGKIDDFLQVRPDRFGREVQKIPRSLFRRGGGGCRLRRIAG